MVGMYSEKTGEREEKKVGRDWTPTYSKEYYKIK